MLQDYSQTYAANITILAGFIGLLLKNFHVTTFTDTDISLLMSAVITLVGIIWQFVHRYNKGDITVAGAKINR